jgi:transcriptional regulator with XRE-family HTH domain
VDRAAAAAVHITKREGEGEMADSKLPASSAGLKWLPARLGASIRAHRKRRGISVTELARRSGLAQSFLSQVELGRSDISVGRLMRVAGVLDVRVSELLELPADAVGHLVRARERLEVPTLEAGLHVFLLSQSLDNGRTYAFTTLEPGTTVGWNHRPDSTESFVYLVEGAVQYHFKRREPILLEAGDTISYRTSEFERMENVHAGPSSFLWVQAAIGQGPE